MSARAFTFISLLFFLCLLLLPCCLSMTKQAKRAKRYVEYYNYRDEGDDEFGDPSEEDFTDVGLLPGEIDAIRDFMVDVLDILDDGFDGDGDQAENSRSVNAEGEPVVIITVEDEEADPTDLMLADLLYEEDVPWGRCTRSCKTSRHRECVYRSLCGTELLSEEAFCYAPGSKCEKEVNSFLESEGYVIVEYTPEDVDEEADADAAAVDDAYVPEEYDFAEDDDYESVLYPDAEENTYGDYYDYGWVDYLLGNTGDTDEAQPGPDANDYEYEEEEEEEEEDDGDRTPGDADEVPFEGCGIRRVKTSDKLRILGGRIAVKGAWPWQVAVMNRFKETFCGGTLIAPQWVMTAAHCLRKRLYVRLGEHHLYSKDKTEVEMRVERSFGHPDFDEGTITHDIGLLKLPRPVTYNKYIQPACLPGPDTVPPVRSKCAVTGWGKEKETHIFGSDVLKYVRVPIVTKAACIDAYPDHPITRNQFCAGFKKGSADTCAGDSGGPLVCDDKGAWTIHGVTSFGEGCGEQGKFGVYTKVRNYLKWIKKIMRDHS
ncbi:transmembrane protease serine 6-like [Macrobrachium nipponense]|uniref:transmembrane protease serine 6-like n=1 Tax=Macrobrachium nipponense TaxID=159736 RepID=UPI0030C88A24